MEKFFLIIVGNWEYELRVFENSDFPYPALMLSIMYRIVSSFSEKAIGIMYYLNKVKFWDYSLQFT